MSLGEISNITVRKKMTESIVRQKLGHIYYLLKDEETYIVRATEVEASHGLPRDTTTISGELQQVLHVAGRRDANKTITPDSALRYARRVIVRLNKEEENAGGKKRNTREVIIKF